MPRRQRRVPIGSRTPDGLRAVAAIQVHVVVYAAICPMARYSVQVYPLLSYLAGVGVSGLFPGRSPSLT